MNVTKVIKIIDMQCVGCEKIIEEAIHQLEGIISVKANYLKANVEIIFDNSKVNLKSIQEVCNNKGYTINWASSSRKQQVFKITLSVLALSSLFIVLIVARKLGHQLSLPEINSQTGDGMIFMVGLLTGLHCVGMCGSFLIGYSAKDAEHGRTVFRPHLLYGLGKTLSYAMFGATFGFIGSLFRITPLISGLSIGIAGTFLILYGLSMLNIFVNLKTIRIRQPAGIATRSIEKTKKTNSPFYIGFFSGFLLGCGPLQAMYIMAAGNGSALEGAKFLTLFGLGTLPALLSFGLLARLLSNTMTNRFIRMSGIILIVLGSMMLNKGLMQARSGDDLKSSSPKCHCHK